MVIFLAVDTIYQVFTVPEILKPLNDSIHLLLSSASLYYLFRVETKKSWIIKEAIYSLGMLHAGVLLGDSTTIFIALSAILIVLARKLF